MAYALISPNTVEIKVSNKTRTIRLVNPMTYSFHGQILIAPKPSVPPGSTSTFKLKNFIPFFGCRGLLSYKLDSFTLTIFFSFLGYFPRMGLELSLDAVHLCSPDVTCKRMAEGPQPPPSETFVSQCVNIWRHQGDIQLSLGPLKVTATISKVWLPPTWLPPRTRTHLWHPVIEVVVEEQARVLRMTPLCPGRGGQEKGEPAGPSGTMVGSAGTAWKP